MDQLLPPAATLAGRAPLPPPDEVSQYHGDKHNMKARFGPIVLSISAGEKNYCTPQAYLSGFADYDNVEIALIDLRMTEYDQYSHRYTLGDFTSPSDLGLTGFDTMMRSDSIEGWVTWAEVLDLFLALRAAFPPLSSHLDVYTIEDWGRQCLPPLDE